MIDYESLLRTSKVVQLADKLFEHEYLKILRHARDPFFPEKELDALRYTMLRAWHTHIGEGVKSALSFSKSHSGAPTKTEIDGIISRIRSRVNGDAFIKSNFRHEALKQVVGAYHKAKREVNAEYHRQTKSAVRKDDFNIDVVDNMSEFEAINALADQIFIAAGDFWDSQLQDSIRAQLDDYLNGELTRDEFAAKLKALVNDRLTSENKDTLGDSYFKRLAHHSIVKTRTIGKFSQAKNLGAKGYKLINPLDRRTSVICRDLVGRGTIYTIAQGQPVVDDLLNAKTTADLKASQPFWKNPNESRIPIPPLHWGDCRTTIIPVFI